MSTDIAITYGSPTSPKSVMDFTSYGVSLSPIKAPPDFFKHDTRAIPPDDEAFARHSSHPVQDEEDSIPTNDENNFPGSSAFLTYLKIKPSDETLAPILRATMEFCGKNPRNPWAAIVDDVMVNQLHFCKAGNNIFCGQVFGHRVVTGQLSNVRLDDWIVGCSDADTSNKFAMLLRSFGMEVKEA